MKQNIRNSGNGAGRIFRRLAAEKKKTVFALCLIGLMVFMWVRVLSKKTPNTAEAAVMTQPEASNISQPNPYVKISFIELPKVTGRNDVISRDFFDSGSWRLFGEGGKIAGFEEVSISKGGSEEIIRRIAGKLRLEAIGLGENPQAFINGKSLSVGGKLLISDAGVKYECKVVRIDENVVFIRCGEAEIKLKLKQAIEVND